MNLFHPVWTEIENLGNFMFFFQKVAQVYNFLYFCAILELKAYKGYYQKFVKTLTRAEYLKFLRALMLLRHSDEQDIPRHYIKYITEGISELRVNYGSNELRLFFFRDGDILVILLNGFRKKTQKTPKKEIDQAIKLKKEYYEQK